MKAPVSAVLLSLGLALSTSAHAQVPPTGRDSRPPSPPMASASVNAEMTEGVVRKVDRQAKKLTMRHGPIRNLDMPEMSMVFRVTDPKMIEGLEPDAKVRFRADRIDGQITVTHMEAAG
jgi:Cu(I)/Ag(I) efflux system protein CusF